LLRTLQRILQLQLWLQRVLAFENPQHALQHTLQHAPQHKLQHALQHKLQHGLQVQL